jgi:hypothetical protein
MTASFSESLSEFSFLFSFSRLFACFAGNPLRFSVPCFAGNPKFRGPKVSWCWRAVHIQVWGNDRS